MAHLANKHNASILFLPHYEHLVEKCQNFFHYWHAIIAKRTSNIIGKEEADAELKKIDEEMHIEKLNLIEELIKLKNTL